MNSKTPPATSKVPVGTVIILLIASVLFFSKSPPKPLSIGYQPPFAPIKLSVDHSGAITLSVSEKLQTPLGTFDIGARAPVTPSDSELAIIVRNRTNNSETHYRLKANDRVAFEESSIVKSIHCVEPKILLVEITTSPSTFNGHESGGIPRSLDDIPARDRDDVATAKPPAATDLSREVDAELPIDSELPHETEPKVEPPISSADVNLPWASPAEFVRNFSPTRGIFETWIVHPYSHRATLVHFHLPGARLREARAESDFIRFSYREGKIRKVDISFQKNGRINVTYD